MRRPYGALAIAATNADARSGQSWATLRVSAGQEDQCATTGRIPLVAAAQTRQRGRRGSAAPTAARRALLRAAPQPDLGLGPQLAGSGGDRHLGGAARAAHERDVDGHRLAPVLVERADRAGAGCVAQSAAPGQAELDATRGAVPGVRDGDPEVPGLAQLELLLGDVADAEGEARQALERERAEGVVDVCGVARLVDGGDRAVRSGGALQPRGGGLEALGLVTAAKRSSGSPEVPSCSNAGPNTTSAASSNALMKQSALEANCS